MNKEKNISCKIRYAAIYIPKTGHFNFFSFNWLAV